MLKIGRKQVKNIKGHFSQREVMNKRTVMELIIFSCRKYDSADCTMMWVDQ